MTKLATFALIAAGFLAISAALLSPEAQAQIPRPGVLCPGGTPGERPVAVARATVILPPGEYGLLIQPPHGPTLLTICHVGSGGSSVTLDYQTCMEVGREVREPTGATILDRIVASCQVPPLEEHSFCGDADDPRSYSVIENGGEVLIDGRIYVTLPPDRFELRYDEGSPITGPHPPGTRSQAVDICNREMNYFVELSLVDCGRQAWSQGKLDSDEILNAIAGSCRLTGSPSSAAIIQPPSVGHAGLKTDD
jgi:hypothetical protein